MQIYVSVEKISMSTTFPPLRLSAHYVNPVAATGFKGSTELSSLT